MLPMWKCCQCQFQFPIGFGNIGFGNIGIGNISTMATINMIAESKPAEKEMMVNLVMTFLA